MIGRYLPTVFYERKVRARAGGARVAEARAWGLNAKETFYFLLLLLLCALASAATVVQNAWGDVTGNHFKLILHVVTILSSRR